jgi:hypothetical protein
MKRMATAGISRLIPVPKIPFPAEQIIVFIINRDNRKKVWKGLGCGEGKNLSLKGFHFPESKFFKILQLHQKKDMQYEDFIYRIGSAGRQSQVQ